MMRIGLKEVFNKKNQITHLGVQNVNLKYVSPTNSFVYELLINANHEVIFNSCTPFCTTELDFNKKIGDLYVGGSSSGSVIDIVDNKIDIAVTTDTGGSTIFPAARHDLYALKPTYGQISRQGLVPLCSTLDTISFLSKTSTNIKEIYHLLLKTDSTDQTQINNSDRESYANKDRALYCPTNLFSEIQIKKLKKIYPQLIEKELKLPLEISFTDLLLGAYYYQLCPDFYSNMARFNGLFQQKDFNYNLVKNYNETYIKNTRNVNLTSEIKSRIVLGAQLIIDQYNPNYNELFKRYLESLLKEDYWIFPICNYNCKEAKEFSKDNHPIYPIIANLTGRPSVTQPTTDLLKGHYIIGPHYSEQYLLDLITNN